MNNFFRNLTWIQDTSLQGEPIYYFPDSMTLIEFDENFGRLLTELKHLDERMPAEDLQGYPEGYVKDVLFNLEVLNARGLMKEFVFPGIPHHVPIGRMIIANTMRCNLACRYCYNRFDFNSTARCEKDMSVKTFQSLVRFLEESGADLPFYELSFIGGEPLLHPRILEEAARWGERRGKELHISATTNATLLNKDMVDFCMKHRIHLKLTVDGGQEEHDANRIFSGGRGSYDMIAQNLPAFFSTFMYSRRYVATTIDTRRSEPVERAIALSAMGFNAIDLVELYSEGTEESGEGLECMFREKYRRLLDFLYLRFRERNYLHMIPLFDIVTHLHLRKPRFLRCRAGGDSLAVSPHGTLFPCHHFFGDDRFFLGTVFDGPLSPSRLAPYRIPVGDRPECSSCWARLLCGGPCYHRSLAATGDAFRCAALECTRITALIMEAMSFYIRLRNEDPLAIDWCIAQGRVPAELSNIQREIND